MIIFNQMISIKTYTIQFSIFYSSGAVFKIAPFFVLFKIAPLYLSWPTISTCLKLLTKDPVLGLIWTRFISKVGQSWTPFIFILTSWYFLDRYFTIKWTYLTKKISPQEWYSINCSIFENFISQPSHFDKIGSNPWSSPSPTRCFQR